MTDWGKKHYLTFDKQRCYEQKGLAASPDEKSMEELLLTFNEVRDRITPDICHHKNRDTVPSVSPGLVGRAILSPFFKKVITERLRSLGLGDDEFRVATRYYGGSLLDEHYTDGEVEVSLDTEELTVDLKIETGHLVNQKPQWVDEGGTGHWCLVHCEPLDMKEVDDFLKCLTVTTTQDTLGGGYE